MATKKELKAEIKELRNAAQLQKVFGMVKGREQVLNEIFGDSAPGPDVIEALKLHLNSTYGMAAVRPTYTAPDTFSPLLGKYGSVDFGVYSDNA